MERRKIIYTEGFRSGKFFLYNENPVYEVWDRISRLSSKEYLIQNFNPEEIDEAKKEELYSYAIVRFNQAIEFKNSSNNLSFITKPLTLYYSFLNLLRAFIAIKLDIIPTLGHGLKFTKQDNILDSKAKICRGTFQDFIKQDSENQLNEISLRESLSHILEFDFDLEINKEIQPEYSPIFIRGYYDGEITLDFLKEYPHFEQDWKSMFPKLISDFKYKENQKLTAHLPDINNYDKMKKYINSNFIASLVNNIQGAEIWYQYETQRSQNILPRESYYFIGMFILSNYVRYEPEYLFNLSNQKSDLYWVISKFLRISERFFPNLLYNKLYDENYFF